MQTPLQKVREEIRADAESARTRASARARSQPRPAQGAPRVAQAARDSYSIGELCRAQFTAFIAEAFFALLRRPPDPAGLEAQLRLLVAGRSKIEILGNLRWSREGREIGVRVPGLLPRYLLAKATRVPVLGYALEWLVCLAGLPMIVRHQRAADATHSARQQELAEVGRDMAARLGTLASELEQLGREFPQLSARLAQLADQVAALPADIERVATDVRELRHPVLSMNHWLATLRQNLSELERAEAEQERCADAFHADTALRMLGADASRPQCIDQWAGQLAGILPAAGRVLDLCSGEDWLAKLAARGLEASGVDTSHRIGIRAREAGLTIVVAEPPAVLARTADDSLDALTALDAGSLLRRMPAQALLDAARRVLRQDGCVLFGFADAPCRIAGRLEGRADPAVDGELMAQALLAAGFGEVRQSSADDGSTCVIARNTKRPS